MSQHDDQLMCQAHSLAARAGARCKVLAMKAGHEGLGGLEDYFKAAAESYMVQARRMLLLLRGKIEPEMERVLADFQNDLAEEKEALGLLISQSQEADNRGLNAAAKQAREVLLGRTGFFQAAKSEDQGGEGYRVCQICGCMIQGDPPKNCPVCHAVQEKFEKV